MPKAPTTTASITLATILDLAGALRPVLTAHNLLAPDGNLANPINLAAIAGALPDIQRVLAVAGVTIEGNPLAFLT